MFTLVTLKNTRRTARLVAAATSISGVLLSSAAYGNQFDPDETMCSIPAGSAAVVPSSTQTLTLGGTAAENALEIRNAIATAIVALNSDQMKSQLIEFPEGTHVIYNENDDDAIVLNGLNLASNGQAISGSGWLILRGVAMNDTVTEDATTLNFVNGLQRGFKGSGTHRLQVCNMHLTRDEMATTQGEIIGFLEGSTWSEDSAGNPPPEYPYGDEVLSTMGTFTTTRPNPSASPNSNDDPGFTTLVVDLHDDFPSTLDIYNDENLNCQSRYLKKYKYFGGNSVTHVNSLPINIIDDNHHTSWIYTAPITTGTYAGYWAIGLGRPGLSNDFGLDIQNNNYTNGGLTSSDYQAGDLLAIRTKKLTDMAWFAAGSDIEFENIRMTRSSRMLFRYGTDDSDASTYETMSDVRLTNIGVDRGDLVGGRVPFISSGDGGPQIWGQIEVTSTGMRDVFDPPLTGPCISEETFSRSGKVGEEVLNTVIEKAEFIATGDDAIGLFNADGFELKQSRIEDSFARGVFATWGTKNACLRSPFERSMLGWGPLPGTSGADEDFVEGCIDDTASLIQPTNAIATPYVHGRITVTWTDDDSNQPSDFYGYQIRRGAANDCSTTAPTEVESVVVSGITGSTGGSGHSYHDRSAKTGHDYRYFVYARDENFNVSAVAMTTCETAL